MPNLDSWLSLNLNSDFPLLKVLRLLNFIGAIANLYLKLNIFKVASIIICHEKYKKKPIDIMYKCTNNCPTNKSLIFNAHEGGLNRAVNRFWSNFRGISHHHARLICDYTHSKEIQYIIPPRIWKVSHSTKIPFRAAWAGPTANGRPKQL